MLQGLTVYLPKAKEVYQTLQWLNVFSDEWTLKKSVLENDPNDKRINN